MGTLPKSQESDLKIWQNHLPISPDTWDGKKEVGILYAWESSLLGAIPIGSFFLVVEEKVLSNDWWDVLVIAPDGRALVGDSRTFYSDDHNVALKPRR